jgi:AraC family L-rhamnose operon transcriptional activator RhaR
MVRRQRGDTGVEIKDFGFFKQSDQEKVVLNKFDHSQEPCPYHYHNFVEITFVESGRGVHVVGGNHYEIESGDICVINTWIAHQFQALPDSSLRIINCLIEPEYLAHLFDLTHTDSELHSLFYSYYVINQTYDLEVDMRLKGKNTLQVHQVLDQMFLEYQAKDPGYVQILESYLRILIYKMMRMFEEKKQLHADKRSEKISNIMAHLREHYNQDMKVESLSELFFVSPKYLSKIFKDLTNMTITEYLQRLRIEKAVDLLRSTDQCIRDIAEEVGYNDVTFFYSIFRRYTGQNPSAIRSSNFTFYNAGEITVLPSP